MKQEMILAHKCYVIVLSRRICNHGFEEKLRKPNRFRCELLLNSEKSSGTKTCEKNIAMQIVRYIRYLWRNVSSDETKQFKPDHGP